jgi:hypothetical protein
VSRAEPPHPRGRYFPSSGPLRAQVSFVRMDGHR